MKNSKNDFDNESNKKSFNAFERQFVNSIKYSLSSIFTLNYYFAVYFIFVFPLTLYLYKKYFIFLTSSEFSVWIEMSLLSAVVVFFYLYIVICVIKIVNKNYETIINSAFRIIYLMFLSYFFANLIYHPNDKFIIPFIMLSLWISWYLSIFLKIISKFLLDIFRGIKKLDNKTLGVVLTAIIGGFATIIASILKG
ncbi:hypothetical protein [Apilactobacillus xinyiensis]|uniref:hypothetical protein n=1 Tax=Apilactobacillus xinyiensis TaxID=2841032 RepID=UPI003364DFA8